MRIPDLSLLRVAAAPIGMDAGTTEAPPRQAARVDSQLPQTLEDIGIAPDLLELIVVSIAEHGGELRAVCRSVMAWCGTHPDFCGRGRNGEPNDPQRDLLFRKLLVVFGVPVSYLDGAYLTDKGRFKSWYMLWITLCKVFNSDFLYTWDDEGAAPTWSPEIRRRLLNPRSGNRERYKRMILIKDLYAHLATPTAYSGGAYRRMGVVGARAGEARWPRIRFGGRFADFGHPTQIETVAAMLNALRLIWRPAQQELLRIYPLSTVEYGDWGRAGTSVLYKCIRSLQPVRGWPIQPVPDQPNILPNEKRLLEINWDAPDAPVDAADLAVQLMTVMEVNPVYMGLKLGKYLNWLAGSVTVAALERSDLMKVWNAFVATTLRGAYSPNPLLPDFENNVRPVEWMTRAERVLLRQVYPTEVIHQPLIDRRGYLDAHELWVEHMKDSEPMKNWDAESATDVARALDRAHRALGDNPQGA